MTETIEATRRRRGAARGRLTRIERDVAGLEAKEELEPSDLRKVNRFREQVKEIDRDYEERHLEVLNMVENEDQDTLALEEEVFDKHVNRVADILEKLGALEEKGRSVAPPVAVAETSHGLVKRLRYINQEKDSIIEAIRLLPTGPEASPRLWLQECQREISALGTQLAGIMGEILSLPGEERDLMDSATIIKKALKEANYHANRLIHSLEGAPKTPETRSEPTIELPKINIPKFDGETLNWVTFWEQFEIAIHLNKRLHDVQKLAYLRDAVEAGPAKHVIKGLSHSAGSYEQAIECLRQRYDKPRLIHQNHVRAIVEAPVVKSGNARELRLLHDVVNQHVRSLRTIKGDTFEAFVSSSVEMKLDRASKFAWQQSMRERRDIPSIDELLEFIDGRAQASESSIPYSSDHKPPVMEKKSKSRSSYQASTERKCVGCYEATHPLYSCGAFAAMSHEHRLARVRKHNLCLNCLRQGHYASQCKSTRRCEECHGKHHTLLHHDASKAETKSSPAPTDESDKGSIANHHTNGRHGSILLMTCQVIIRAPDGATVQVRALLDSGSEASFITERMAQQLRLSRRRQGPTITCIGGSTPQIRSKGLVNLQITDTSQAGKVHPIEALVLPKITSNTPAYPVSIPQKWKHLLGLSLADPDYGTPGAVDMLLGADVFSRVVLHGRRFGPVGSPSAFKTQFGWVLAGSVGSNVPVVSGGRSESCHLVVAGMAQAECDELLRKFWEVENPHFQEPMLSIRERSVLKHFEETHYRNQEGRFVVPLPLNSKAIPLGESRAMAVQRLKGLERSLYRKGQFKEFARCMNEYFELGHAEPVPSKAMKKPSSEVFYMPMHAVWKDSSTTTKLRVVFDASAKSTSGSSLNDQFLVGPTVHPPLIDVLLRFRRFKVAMTTDVGKMYRAVIIPEDQRDLHRFLWRENRAQPVDEFRMTRLTFGVSASSFAANMALRQNILDHQHEYPQAAKVALDSFYVDDCLAGANSVDDAIGLRRDLQRLFSLGGFTLRKWKASDITVANSIPQQYRDKEPSHLIQCSEDFTKVLGLEWNTTTDAFRPMVPTKHEIGRLTKRQLLSSIAGLFDVLGWCSPAIITPKILLQRLWEERLDWDDVVPQSVSNVWEKWIGEVDEFRRYSIPRCYFAEETGVKNVQLHGFSDASEKAYAGVVYLRGLGEDDEVLTSLVMAKTKVAPIKRMTIPRLELCGALVLARLLKYVSVVLSIPTKNVFAWSDSRVVLGWLRGDPRRFKVFVGNRVSEILDLLPPNAWRHVASKDNPADCASRGLYPSQLASHKLWWHGPEWLGLPEIHWPAMDQCPALDPGDEVKEERIVLRTDAESQELPLLRRVSSYTRLIRVTAWVLRFVSNCRKQPRRDGTLTTEELKDAEGVWIARAQRAAFSAEIKLLGKGKPLPRSSKIIAFRPYVDDKGLLRVGGRIGIGRLSFARRHPLILPRDHRMVELLIMHEHLRLLHAGPTLVSASLARQFCIVRGRRAIRALIHDCVVCKRVEAKPKPQLLGQLPLARLRPGDVFSSTGVDYAGPIYIKSGPVRKPIITKGYVAVFVSLSVKAVHLEPVTELTTSAFIATLRRFIARRGIPSTIWSDNGTNFVGAAKEIKKLVSDSELRDHCTHQGIQWRFIPEYAPHFGGLWEAAVRSFKRHLRKVVGDVRLTYEELTTTLAQIEACLNSRPLTPLPEPSDGIEVLTPGHFLIGKPLTALPDPPESRQPMAMLRRWHLCQRLASHFWNRWSKEYLTTLNRFAKWQRPAENIRVDDIVCIRDEPTSPTKWPIARVIAVYPGIDGKVRVVKVRTTKGTYKRPVTKLVPLLRPDQ